MSHRHIHSIESRGGRSPSSFIRANQTRRSRHRRARDGKTRRRRTNEKAKVTELNEHPASVARSRIGPDGPRCWSPPMQRRAAPFRSAWQPGRRESQIDDQDAWSHPSLRNVDIQRGEHSILHVTLYLPWPCLCASMPLPLYSVSGAVSAIIDAVQNALNMMGGKPTPEQRGSVTTPSETSCGT